METVPEKTAFRYSRRASVRRRILPPDVLRHSHSTPSLTARAAAAGMRRYSGSVSSGTSTPYTENGFCVGS